MYVLSQLEIVGEREREQGGPDHAWTPYTWPTTGEVVHRSPAVTAGSGWEQVKGRFKQHFQRPRGSLWA